MTAPVDPPWSPGADADGDESARPFGSGRPIFSSRPPQTSARRTPEQGTQNSLGAGVASGASGSAPPLGDRIEEEPRSATSSGEASSNGGGLGGFGPNLRGSLNRGTQLGDQPPRGGSGSTTFQLERMPRLSLSKVPELTHLFVGWREEVEGGLLASGIGARNARQFIWEMNTQSEAWLQQIPDDDNIANLDAVLWAEILKAMKGTKHSVLVQEFTSQLVKGCGRAAMKRLGELMRFELRHLAVRAQGNLERRKCPNKEGMAKFHVETTYDLDVLEAAQQKQSETAVYSKLAKALRPYQKDAIEGVDTVFAAWDARPDEEARDYKDLLKALKMLGVRQQTLKEDLARERGTMGKEKKGKGGGKGGNAPQQGAGGGAPGKKGNHPPCAGCGKTNHPAEKCWTLHMELMPEKFRGTAGTEKKKKGKGGGKGSEKERGTAANAEEEKPKHDPCTHCGRRNHLPGDCFYKPLGAGGEQTKSGRAASASTPPAPGPWALWGFPPMSATGPFGYPGMMAYSGVPSTQPPPPPPQMMGGYAMPTPPGLGGVPVPWPAPIQPPPPPPVQGMPVPDKETLGFLAYLRGQGPPRKPHGAVARVQCHNTAAVSPFGAPGPTEIFTLDVIDDLYAKAKMQMERGTPATEQGTAGIAGDTGASRHIVDARSDSIVKLIESPGAAKIDAVGGEVECDLTAEIVIPGIQGPRKALAVTGSPDCASIGEFCVEEFFGFFWPPGSRNPYLVDPNGNKIILEVDNNVPYFVPT